MLGFLGLFCVVCVLVDAVFLAFLFPVFSSLCWVALGVVSSGSFVW